jgi:peptidoglycan/LPS O-acetylase OafA/YrhL
MKCDVRFNSATSVSRGDQPVNIPFLDGLRGLASLGVAAFHAFQYTGLTLAPAVALPGLARFFLLGPIFVAVFIVLSGFVLMAPVVVSGHLRGGWWKFMQRRAKRILGPYYAALAFFIVAIAVVPALQHMSGTAWDRKLPLDGGAIVSHLFLIQDTSPFWLFKIDGPMWSVAVEFQIYIVFALVLVPIARRLGAVWAAVIGFGVAGVVREVFGPASDIAHPWYLGCFGLGMLAAEVALGDSAWARRGRAICHRHLVLGACVALVVGCVAKEPWAILHFSVVEPVVSVAVAGLLVVLVTRHAQGISPTARLLSSRPLLFIGLASYSIYLIHNPLLGWFNLATLHVSMSMGLRLAMMLGVALPIAVGVSILFHFAVERRFMSGHMRDMELSVGSVLEDCT